MVTLIWSWDAWMHSGNMVLLERDYKKQAVE